MCAVGGTCCFASLGARGWRFNRACMVCVSLRLLSGMVQKAREKTMKRLDKDMKPSWKREKRYRSETLIGIYMDADEKTKKARAKRYYRQLRKIWEGKNQ